MLLLIALNVDLFQSLINVDYASNSKVNIRIIKLTNAILPVGTLF